MNDFKKFYDKTDRVFVSGSAKLISTHIQGIETKEGIAHEFNVTVEIKTNINEVCPLKLTRKITHRLTNDQMKSISSCPL